MIELILSLLYYFIWQKTRYDPRNVDEQLPPPPSPPQIKEPIQLDGISRPNSVERVLHPDTQHILANHDALNKVSHKHFIN